MLKASDLRKTSQRQLIREAREIASNLIELGAMDTDAFWGDEVFDEALKDASGMQLARLDVARQYVVNMLRTK